MSKPEFHDAPDVSEVVRAVIEEVPEHGHLQMARIRCLRRTGRWTVKDRARWANIRVLPAELRHVAAADIVLTVNACVGQGGQLDDCAARRGGLHRGDQAARVVA